MNSLRHVFWRGAMALSLMALGIGSGFGFREAPLQADAEQEACAGNALRAARPAGIDPARDIAQRVRVNRGVRRG